MTTHTAWFCASHRAKSPAKTNLKHKFWCSISVCLLNKMVNAAQCKFFTDTVPLQESSASISTSWWFLWSMDTNYEIHCWDKNPALLNFIGKRKVQSDGFEKCCSLEATKLKWRNNSTWNSSVYKSSYVNWSTKNKGALCKSHPTMQSTTGQAEVQAKSNLKI